MNCYFLLLAASLCVLPLHAQKEYPIDRITAINLGDGRILHREISGDKPLDGEHRIIDGYHSAYILARFKDGLYNGDYEEYIYNKLKAKGSYKEGWKDGTFRKYDDEGRVTIGTDIPVHDITYLDVMLMLVFNSFNAFFSH